MRVAAYFGALVMFTLATLKGLLVVGVQVPLAGNQVGEIHGWLWLGLACGAVVEACVGGMLVRRAWQWIGARAMILLGLAFAVWLMVATGFGIRWKTCGCFGQFVVAPSVHLAVACGLIVLGGVILALSPEESPPAPLEQDQ